MEFENFKDLHDGQCVDIVYKAGKTKRLTTVRNLRFSCYFESCNYISFFQDVKPSFRNKLGYREVCFDVRRIVSMVERKQPLQVGDTVKFSFSQYGKSQLGVITKLNYFYDNPVDFKKTSFISEDVEVVTLNEDQPRRVLVYSWLVKKEDKDSLEQAEEILQKELENIKEELNKIQQKKKFCKLIAKAGK